MCVLLYSTEKKWYKNHKYWLIDCYNVMKMKTWFRKKTFFLYTTSDYNNDHIIKLIFIFVAGRDYWYEEARSALKKRLAGFEGKMERAKNVVFLVGDGMGASTLTASRIFKGQRRGNQGEEEQLLWDTFLAVAMAKVGKVIFK